MSRMVRRRWKTKFARFILDFGATELSQEIDVHPSAIYHWVHGSTTPRPAHAEIIQRLAGARGVKISMDEIYQHSRQVRSGRRLEERSEVSEIRETRPRRTADVLPFPSDPERRATAARVLRELGKSG